MARGINKAIIVGNLGKNPEVRYAANGTAITNITVATSDVWKDKQSGEQKERTEWHRIVFFGRLAEVAAEYLNKGSQVYIEGRMQTRKWQDQNGQDRYTTEIVAGELQMLGGKSGGNNRGKDENENQDAGGKGPEFDDDLDDDIPFLSANAVHDVVFRRRRRV